MTRTSEKGNRYALSALRNKRATIAAEIVQLERQLRHRKDSLVHVDATLKLLDPSIELDSIPTKRITRRVKLFRQGELGRLILGALRKTQGLALSTAEIVTDVLAAGGHGEAARPTLTPRVRGTWPTFNAAGRSPRWQRKGCQMEPYWVEVRTVRWKTEPSRRRPANGRGDFCNLRVGAAGRSTTRK